MHDVLNDKALYHHFNLRLNNRPSRKGGLKFEIPKVKYEVGKESPQYRGQVIWNFSLKSILRRLSKNINSFSFEAPMIAMKDRNVVYF